MNCNDKQSLLQQSNHWKTGKKPYKRSLFVFFPLMHDLTPDMLLQKYADTIKEEVNVKEVHLLPSTTHVTKEYAPIGKELSSAFGKDTGRIIAAAKAGNAQENADKTLTVTDGSDTRTLASHQYEIRYSGIDETTQTVEDGIIVSLSTEITPALKDEGVARELSRFLNQMRKDADFNVADRVICRFATDSEYMKTIVHQFSDYLEQEALLKTIEASLEPGEIQAAFTGEEGTVTFILQR